MSDRRFMQPEKDSPEKPGFALEAPVPNGAEVRLRFFGRWTRNHPRPSADSVLTELRRQAETRCVVCRGEDLTSWDSTFVSFVRNLSLALKAEDRSLDISALPQGVQRLLELAEKVPGPVTVGAGDGATGFLARVGKDSREFLDTTIKMLSFLGETCLALFQVVRGRGQLRSGDLLQLMQECGAEAVPIVSLISLMVGMILAFVGAVQLKLFGAEIYVASLVGIAVIRVMGAIMTGVIMAGRTGAAYAARLGTMQVTEEVDALRTLGISPMEFLVVPRVLALSAMLPLLCLYANILGVLGGALVAVSLLDVGFVAYLMQTWATVRLQDLGVGLFHGLVFGALVAMAGCMHGMHCGRSASAVGMATTAAVVTGIVSIILSTAVITVLCNVLGI